MSPSRITSYHFVLLHYMYDATLQRFRTPYRPAAPAHRHWSLQCDRYKSIDIEVSISISMLLRQRIDIGIDDTFKAGIDIEYRRYFWKISITTLKTTIDVLPNFGVIGKYRGPCRAKNKKFDQF